MYYRIKQMPTGQAVAGSYWVNDRTKLMPGELIELDDAVAKPLIEVPNPLIEPYHGDVEDAVVVQMGNQAVDPSLATMSRGITDDPSKIGELQAQIQENEQAKRIKELEAQLAEKPKGRKLAAEQERDALAARVAELEAAANESE